MTSAETHLWWVDLDADRGPGANLDPGADRALEVDRRAALLWPDERARAARFVFERDRRHFVLARTALRSILGARVGIPAAELELVHGVRGKPALAPWCQGEDLRFNLSHSGGLAVVALAHGVEIGVDVERVRPFRNASSLVSGEFSGAESAIFESLPAEARNEAFFQAWVRKEAFLKATGEGLSRPLADIEVTFAPDDVARVLAVSGDAAAARRWSMTSLLPRPGYVAALVTHAPVVHAVQLGFHHLAPLSSEARPSRIDHRPQPGRHSTLTSSPRRTT